MQLKNNLLILGDSYCARREYWPQQFAESLGLSFLDYGLDKKFFVSGTIAAGWWAIRHNYLTYLNEYKDFFEKLELVVWIHPYSARTFCLDSNVYIQTPLSKIAPKGFEEQQSAIWFYYKYIHSDEFHYWAQTQWWIEINDLLKNYKNVVHLFVTQEDADRSQILNGKKIKTSLLELSMSQYLDDKTISQRDNRLGFRNHFSPENNTIFSQQLYEIVSGNREDFDIDQFKKYHSDVKHD